jgi:hypothetical protein
MGRQRTCGKRFRVKFDALRASYDDRSNAVPGAVAESPAPDNRETSTAFQIEDEALRVFEGREAFTQSLNVLTRS